MTPATLPIVRNDLRILRRDPVYAISFVLMPVIMMSFTKGAFAANLREEGLRDATGAEQAIPGAAVLFAFFLVGNVGFGVFREHGWETWDRLRLTSEGSLSLLVSKLVTPILTLTAQQVVIFAAGAALFGYRAESSWLQLAVVDLLYIASIGGIGALLLALCRTVMQLTTFANLGAILLGGLGGALTPFATLPGPAQFVGRFTPTFWAMDGLRSISDGSATWPSLIPNMAVLAGITLVGVAVAAQLFRASEQRIMWA